MEPLQQPYNLFAQQKMAGYPSYQDTQKRVPGQVQGETPEQFAAGKQAANSQSGAVSQPVVEQTPAPVVQNTQQKNFWGGPDGTHNDKLPTINGNSSTAGMDYLNSLYTDPKEEERLRKASVMNQRILAIGDALRHIGNIANTVNYAPAQQFNSPVELERKRYLQGKALRDKANLTYLTYQQQKAAQDAKQRQWEATFNYNAARDAARMQAQQNQWEAQNKERARQFDQNFAFNQQKWKETSDLNERKLKQQTAYKNTMAGIANKRAEHYINGGGSGGGEWSRTSRTKINRDDEGREVSRETTIERKNSKTGENSTTKTSKKGNGKTNLLPGGNKKGGSLLPKK